MPVNWLPLPRKYPACTLAVVSMGKLVLLDRYAATFTLLYVTLAPACSTTALYSMVMGYVVVATVTLAATSSVIMTS